MAFFPGMGFIINQSSGGAPQISPTPTYVYKTVGTSTWWVPSNYQPIGSVFDMYGAGGANGPGSYRSASEYGSGGGGGGGFCRKTEFALTPSSWLYYSVGEGGGNASEDGGGTWINRYGNYAPTSSSHGGRAYGGGGGGAYSGGSGGGALYGSINRTGGNGADGWLDSIGDSWVGHGGGGGGCAGTSSNGGSGYNQYGGSGGGGYAGDGGDEPISGSNYGSGAGGHLSNIEE